MAVSIEKISIALPPEMVAQVRQAGETGEYASSSEVVRDALRDWTYKRRLQQKGLEELREFWLEVRKNDTPGVPAKDVLDWPERMYHAIADATGATKSMWLELSPYIERNVKEIGDWIAQDNPTRAVSFIQEIREELRRIGEDARLAVVGRYLILSGSPAT